jgi:hypothetical protein
MRSSELGDLGTCDVLDDTRRGRRFLRFLDATKILSMDTIQFGLSHLSTIQDGVRLVIAQATDLPSRPDPAYDRAFPKSGMAWSKRARKKGMR